MSLEVFSRVTLHPPFPSPLSGVDPTVVGEGPLWEVELVNLPSLLSPPED